MIHAYYVSEVGVDNDTLWATNHGSAPFEGVIAISLHSIAAIVERHHGRRESSAVGPNMGSHSALEGATDDTWVADIWLTSGDHIWLYDDTIETAGAVGDSWAEHRKKEHPNP